MQSPSPNMTKSDDENLYTTVGKRNYFTIIFRTLRQSHILIPSIEIDSFIAYSALEDV